LAALVALPWLLQLGLGLFALGLVGDMAFHLLPPARAAELARVLDLNAEEMHLAIFAGMVATFLGVLQRGLRRGR
jgi:hypothetical protein